MILIRSASFARSRPGYWPNPPSEDRSHTAIPPDAYGGGATHFAIGVPHGGGGPHGTPLRLGTRSRHGRRAPRGAPLHGGRQRQIRGSVPSHGARVLEVRIHLPPADSPSLSRSHFRASRTRAFPAGVRGSLDDGVSRDAAGFPLRANRRQCLCRAIFQYRSAADAVGGNATTVRTKSGVSGL